MFRFFQQTSKFKKSFHLNCYSHLVLNLQYPLFVMQNLSKNPHFIFNKIFAKWFLFFKNHKVVLQCKNLKNQKVAVPVSFDDFGLSNFKEIFFGGEYKADTKLNIGTLVDAGSNTGMATLFFSLTNNLKKVTMIEANDFLISEINENTRQSLADIRVEVLNKCLYPVSHKQLSFNVAQNHRDSGLDSKKNVLKKIEVETISLADVVKGMDLEIVDMLKLDIEGGEHALIDQEPTSFLKFKYLFAEVHGDYQRCEGFIEKLKALGFNASVTHDNTKLNNCLNLFAVNTNLNNF